MSAGIYRSSISAGTPARAGTYRREMRPKRLALKRRFVRHKDFTLYFNVSLKLFLDAGMQI